MSTRKAVGMFAMIPVLLLACTEGDTPAAPDVALTAAADHTFFEFVQHFIVCKEGTDADFEYVTVDNGSGAVIASGSFSVADGTCEEIQFWDAGDPVKQVTVTELSGPYTLLGTVKDTYAGMDVLIGSVAGTSASVSGLIGNDIGILVTFTNEPPQTGGEGCTPGYWKQEQHFDSWVGFTPDDPFFPIFEDAFPGMTLLEVASQGGGGLYALGRHTVAALLNAASGGVAYDMSVQGVIDAFNAVYPGENYDYNMLKDVFEGYNEQGCPLN